MLISRRTKLWFGLVVGCGVASVSRPSAADLPQGLSLRYDAPATCPDGVRFREAVVRRLGHSFTFDEVQDGSVARVRIALDVSGATAEVSFESPGVAPNRREFATATCDEAVEAAALVVALLIDPASADPSAAKAEAASAEPKPATKPVATEPARPLEPARELAPAPPAAPASSARAFVAHSPFTFGAALALDFGVAPSALWAGGVRVGFDPRPDRVAVWTPHGALSAFAARTGVVSAAADRGIFTWLTSRIEGCSSKWRLVDSLSFEPCLIAELGALSARGREGAISRPVSATRFWASAGLLPSLALHVHPLQFRFGAGVRGVFTPYEFVFDNPRQSVYTVSKVTGLLEFSVSVEP